MKILQYLFQKRIVIVLLLILVFINLFNENYIHFGINKTVGWAFDITDFSPIIFLITFYSFILIYGILALSKKETNMKISIGHVIVVSISAILLENRNAGLLTILNCLSVILFVMNIFKSLKQKNQSAHNSR
ncbi:hypothetical protein [Flavobacterium stagni]|uniref:Uncharacterized protein n=1 Tax=Flavobacterium stagni TaxID=2506421 RepID=A0A4Q1K2D8_9FLAO|nr:hypothetical protein [Flavobacterium stagni]RXR18869.1 hypothetical protein EQG61_13640 [Flavobacterium stagni]